MVDQNKQIEAFYKSKIGLSAAHLLQKKLRKKINGLSLHASIRIMGTSLPIRPLLEKFEDCKELAALDKQIKDCSIDAFFFLHLPPSTNLPNLINKAWHSLAGSGELFLLVPNRYSLWRAFCKPPFYAGKPYSKGAVMHLLRCNHFQIEHAETSFIKLPFLNYFIAFPWLPFGSFHLIYAKKYLFHPILDKRIVENKSLAIIPQVGIFPKKTSDS